MRLVKVLSDSTGIKNIYVDGVLRHVGIKSSSDVDGEALMTSVCYNKIFKTHKKTADNSLKRLYIVKISANGQVIYRSYRGVSATDFLSDYVALSPSSIMMLNDKDGNEPLEVKVSKGYMFPFYWYHPDKAIRISARLGILSLLLGVISFIIACVSLFLAI